MMVVIAIIAILTALVSGATLYARERGRMVKCSSNLSSLGAALTASLTDNNGAFTGVYYYVTPNYSPGSIIKYNLTMKPTQVWNTNTHYNVGDEVWDKNVVYTCINPNINSEPPAPPGPFGSNWQPDFPDNMFKDLKPKVLICPDDSSPQWNGSTLYNPGNQVWDTPPPSSTVVSAWTQCYPGSLPIPDNPVGYTCIAANTRFEPPNMSYWIPQMGVLAQWPGRSTEASSNLGQNQGVPATVPTSYAYNVVLPVIYRNLSRVAQPGDTVSFYDGNPWSFSGTEYGSWPFTQDQTGSSVPQDQAKNSVLYRHSVQSAGPVWKSSTTYNVGNEVWDKNIGYTCINQNTNSEPPNGNWQATTGGPFLIHPGEAALLYLDGHVNFSATTPASIISGIWNNSTTYYPGNTVMDNGNNTNNIYTVYVCIAQNINSEPPNSAYWQSIGPPP
jgi:hypothetical protein